MSMLLTVVTVAACRNSNDAKPQPSPVATQLPAIEMVDIPTGGYTVTAPLLPRGKSCTRELVQQLASIDLGHAPAQLDRTLIAFAIDKRRASCHDYLTCVHQHACPAGIHAYDEETDCNGDAAYVPRRNAVAYCAWRGLQLPTYPQWQGAARGHSGARSLPCTPTKDGRSCESLSALGLVLVGGAGPQLEFTRTTDCWPDRDPYPAGEHPVMASIMRWDTDEKAELHVDVPSVEFPREGSGQDGQRAFFRCVRESNATAGIEGP